MAKKYYAVRVGREQGIYESWAACQKQISGFSGAVYKGFGTREEARAFIEMGGSVQETIEKPRAVAYVDGSYDASSKAFSYGMVLFHDGKELHFSERFDDSGLAQMHNVAGELKGAEAAMRYCLENDIPDITIYHDYEGIAKWCSGEWQAKKPGTIAYADYYKKASARVKIRFVKVRGHSGDRYNDMADRLAKSALGLDA